MSLGLINVDNNTIFRKLCNFRLGEFNSECIFNYFPHFFVSRPKKKGECEFEECSKAAVVSAKKMS